MQPPKAHREERGQSILVVEDDRPTRDLLSEILAAEQIPFHATSTGHEAMEYVRDQRPGMVVLDMHLPNLQGEAVGTALRIEFGQALPILAMSASDERAAAERLGAFGYLPKPFDVDEFVAFVYEGLRLAGQADQLRQRSSAARQRLEDSSSRQREAFEQARAAELHPPDSAALS